MAAPEEFAAWLGAHEHEDKNLGWVYRYHPRSNAHSNALCSLILTDLLAASEIMREQALSGLVVYRINCPHAFPNGKQKTLDLAIGTPKTAGEGERHSSLIQSGDIGRVLISCEAKTVMTEHIKSQPRVFDELASSHEIVHQGDRLAIAAGITVVNIAQTFVSPLRQKSRKHLHVSTHKQPRAAAGMIRHLRGLPIRGNSTETGFDAYSTIVVDCDNRSAAELWTDSPAPQPGESDHYSGFVQRIVSAFESRFGNRVT